MANLAVHETEGALRVIDRKKVIQRIKSQIEVCKEIESDWISLTVGTGKRILELIDEQPVTRCKDCKYYDLWEGMKEPIGTCVITHRNHKPEWYCADGRK